MFCLELLIERRPDEYSRILELCLVVVAKDTLYR